MNKTAFLAILCCAVGVLDSEAQNGLIFADGFEDETVCAWSLWEGIHWYEDLDGDGFGNDDIFVTTCSPPTSWVYRDRFVCLSVDTATGGRKPQLFVTH